MIVSRTANSRTALSERYKIILLCAFPPLRQSSNALQVLYSLPVRQEHTQKYWKNRLHHCSCNSSIDGPYS